MEKQEFDTTPKDRKEHVKVETDEKGRSKITEDEDLGEGHFLHETLKEVEKDKKEELERLC